MVLAVVVGRGCREGAAGYLYRPWFCSLRTRPEGNRRMRRKGFPLWQGIIRVGIGVAGPEVLHNSLEQTAVHYLFVELREITFLPTLLAQESGRDWIAKRLSIYSPLTCPDIHRIGWSRQGKPSDC